MQKGKNAMNRNITPPDNVQVSQGKASHLGANFETKGRLESAETVN